MGLHCSAKNVGGIHIGDRGQLASVWGGELQGRSPDLMVIVSQVSGILYTSLLQTSLAVFAQVTGLQLHSLAAHVAKCAITRITFQESIPWLWHSG